jgi:hypothetical protein
LFQKLKTSTGETASLLLLTKSKGQTNFSQQAKDLVVDETEPQNDGTQESRAASAILPSRLWKFLRQRGKFRGES